ncbi:hypothetical protein [Actibacterium atlanticum]|nr:hypothetical protein [Actibacterium atlanticum]
MSFDRWCIALAERDKGKAAWRARAGLRIKGFAGAEKARAAARHRSVGVLWWVAGAGKSGPFAVQIAGNRMVLFDY